MSIHFNLGNTEPTGATAKAIAELATQRAARDQGRVLLVSDAPAATLLGTALEQAGFAVVGVAGGAAALVALRRTRPHLVVANADLKGITIGELTKMLVEATDSVLFVLAGTAAASLPQRSAAMTAGAFDYFHLPDELPLLVARARQLITLKQMMDRLRAEAERDYLTGLSNRRHFRSALNREVERWRRYQVPCALVIVDVDHLKRVNDTYGHPAGDVAIRHVATALTQLSRDNDTASRLGGEEFALLLAGADAAKATVAAERLREVVAKHKLDDIGYITVSLGVAACPVHATTERALYAASDAALYRAKHEGRNQLVVAPVLPVVNRES